MELNFSVIALSFSDIGPFAFPNAVVRIRLASEEEATISSAFIDLKIHLTDTVPPGADLQAIACAAVRIAHAIVQHQALAAHLQATLDREAQDERQNTLQGDAAIAARLHQPGS